MSPNRRRIRGVQRGLLPPGAAHYHGSSRPIRSEDDMLIRQSWRLLGLSSVALAFACLARPVASPAQGKTEAAGTRLVEVSRFKTSITSFEDVLVAPAGDVVVVQDVLGKLQ